jgi:putative ABC transport system permease protein
MLRVALRNIRAHLVRFLLSVLAVSLGVAFVAGTFSLRTMLDSTFSDIISTTTIGDAYVRGAHESGIVTATASSLQGAARVPVPLSLVDEIESVEGVDFAMPDLSGSVVLVGADGTAVQSTSAPSFGLAYDVRDTSGHLVAGVGPTSADEIALESATLASSGLHVGDTTSILVAGELRTVHVVGEVGSDTPFAGATISFLDPLTAVADFAPDGVVPTIAVFAEDGVGEDELVEGLGPVVGAADAEAIPREQMRTEAIDAVASQIGFVTTFLLIFASISLFVGAFIIANTFSMSVRQRMREFALLRAVGASPVQVFTSIVVQAAAVGAAGATIGVAAGLGLVVLVRGLLEHVGMDLTGEIPLDASTVILSVLVGVLVSVVAAAVPARRAALVPPVEALRDDVAVPERSLRWRAVLGSGLLVLAACGVAWSVIQPDSASAKSALGLGAIAAVVGMLTVAPVLARSVLRVLGAVFLPLRPVGRLARGNVTRNPRRTANTAGALMIGMALVGGAAVIAATAETSTRSIVDRESNGDLVLQSVVQSSIPTEAVDAVRALPGVLAADAGAVGDVAARHGSDEAVPVTVAGIDPAAIGRSLTIDVLDGSLTEALARGDVAVQRTVVEANGWALGDELTLGGATRQRTVRIGAIIDSHVVGAPLTAPQEVLDDVVSPVQQRVAAVFITGVPTADLDLLRADVTAVVKPFVVIAVMDAQEFANKLADQVNQILVLLYALLGLSLVIAVLGIVNTLALSVIERTREIGLLRAVGLGRLQLGATVTVESILTAVFGTVVGLAVGVGLASALPTVFADEGLGELSVPWGSLAGMVVLAVVVGVLAAVWPAARAARLGVLDAISSE